MAAPPKIYNITCVTADQEYSQALSSFSSVFSIKPRGNNDIKIAFVATESGTKYWSVFGGASDEHNGPYGGIMTVYFQSAVAGTVVEIIETVR